MARMGIDKWFALGLACLTTLVAVVVFVVRIDDRVASLDKRFEVVEKTIDDIAPRKVKVTAQACATPPQAAVAVNLPHVAPWPRLSTEALP